MENVITEDEARRNIVENLRCIMAARGIKQRKLAEATRRPVMTINRMCRGKSLPTVALAAAVAEVLGYSVEDLIGDPTVIATREKLQMDREKFLVSA